MLENIEKKAKKSIIKICLDILSYAILGVLCLFIVYMLVFMFKGMKSNEPPSVFNHQIYIVQSNSMSPTFKTGSLLIVNKTDKQFIKETDIITFRRSGDSVATTHRVVDILKDDGLQFVTRGDANNVDDPMPVNAEDVSGVVVTAIPYLGYLIGFIRTKQGLLVCIVIPALVIILAQVLKLLKEEKKKERKPTIEELQAKVNELLNKEPEQEDNK
jgi:signal peptidase